MHRISTLCALAAVAASSSCRSTDCDPTAWRVIDYRPFTATLADRASVSLRGVSSPNEETVWVSGQRGTVLQSSDGGQTWTDRSIAAAPTDDLRSLHAFNDGRCVAVSTTNNARIWLFDGAWRSVFEAEHSETFLDAIAFAPDGRTGVVFGDPDATGHFTLLITKDGGATWNQALLEPAALPGEAGFAASGSVVAFVPALEKVAQPRFAIATGGAARTRLLAFTVPDQGTSPQAHSISRLPLQAGAPSKGTFAVSFAEDGTGVAVGGDYRTSEDSEATAAFTTDRGLTWYARDARGYRSTVVSLQEQGHWLAAGPSGIDLSTDGGTTWIALPTEHDEPSGGLHALDRATGAATVYGCGASGRIVSIRRVTR